MRTRGRQVHANFVPLTGGACAGLGLEPENALLKQRIREAESYVQQAPRRPMPSAWAGNGSYGVPPETGLPPGQGLPANAASLAAMAQSSRLATLLTLQGVLRTFMLLQVVRPSSSGR